MLFPKSLSEGDCIFFTAPSSCIERRLLKSAVKLFENRKYKVCVGRSCYERLYGYLAGDRKLRAYELNRAFLNSRYNAVICVRGGYGSAGLAEYLDFEAIKECPKIFAGYSDITALHMMFNKFCGFATYHAPMPVSDYEKFFNKYTYNSYFNMLEGKYIERLEGIRVDKSKKEVKGKLIGGNLSIICQSFGTFYEPDYNGKILFIEDIDENIQKIDRMFTQLMHSGVFDKTAGIVFGNFNNCINNKDASFQIEDLIEEYFHNSNYPVLKGIEAGHCTQTATLAFGVEYIIKGNFLSFDNNAFCMTDK